MSNRNGHWWEFYTVRYAQGTVIGAIIVFFLFSRNLSFRELLFIPAETGTFGTAHLLLFATYGLAYCYIASAPILVLHAGRGLLFDKSAKENGRPTRFFFLLVLLFFLIVVSNYTETPMLFFSCLTPYTLIIAIQLFILYALLSDTPCWERVFTYYTILAKKRMEFAKSSYIESYKHIREHGNAFFITFCEVVLALPLYFFMSKAADKGEVVANLSFVLFLWIIPPSLIWFFGNKLEHNLQFLHRESLLSDHSISDSSLPISEADSSSHGGCSK